MSVLIDLNDARKKLNELEGSAEYNKGVTDAFNVLFDLPTLEAEPAKRGRWELKYHKLWGRDFPTCTVCGNPFYATKYCPNCGADMRSKLRVQPRANEEEQP